MNIFKKMLALVVCFTLTFLCACEGNNSAQPDGTDENNSNQSVLPEEPDTDYFDDPDYFGDSMPVLNIDGNLDGISKENKVIVPVSYVQEGKNAQSFSCYATLKYQGATSLNYDKKNFSIQFFKDEKCTGKNKITFVDSWGKQSKYCLKANYVDYSQSRNVVSAKLYGQVVKAGYNVMDELKNLPNGGAIDGFPVVVNLKGEFLGLYTLNIPKDKWMFDMDDEDVEQAILMADDWTDSTFLKQNVSYDFSSTGWDLEYCSTEDTDTRWVCDSFNEMMNFVNENDGVRFQNGIGRYIDIDRTIDSMLHTFFICAADNVAKNILWVTFDGKTWFSSCYDLDGTWGLIWNGTFGYDPKTFMLPKDLAGSNRLWAKLYANFYEDICYRYAELRESVYTMENIEKLFTNFDNLIDEDVKLLERQKWPNVPSQNTNNISQILKFAQERIATFDRILLN